MPHPLYSIHTNLLALPLLCHAHTATSGPLQLVFTVLELFSPDIHVFLPGFYSCICFSMRLFLIFQFSVVPSENLILHLYFLWHYHHPTNCKINLFYLHWFPPLDCKFPESRDLYVFCLLLYPQHSGQCQEHRNSWINICGMNKWMHETLLL